MRSSILLFGGSFDPIHYGHLKSINAIQASHRFDSCYFLPCKLSVLKQKNHASALHRIKMIKSVLRTLDNANFGINYSEVTRHTPSFMIETLYHIRQQCPNYSLVLLLGQDSFNQLPRWHQWQNILKLTHLLVITRPNVTPNLTPFLQDLLNLHLTQNKSDLKKLSHGLIFQDQAGSYPISSTLVRKKHALHQAIQNLVPQEVYRYIVQHKLYLD